MKIAITADPELPVPPCLYGGIERVIDLLVRGLVQRGHDVTLFAHRDSTSPCTVVPYRRSNSQSRLDTLLNMTDITRKVVGGRFDVLHGFGRLAYLLPLLPLPIPKLMTYQRRIAPRSVRWGHRLSRGSLRFSAISRSMMAGLEELAQWDLVYNGVSMNHYRFAPTVPADAPLVFLGRIEAIKGAHIAIEVAQKAGRRLVIAGNVPDGHQTYFHSHVAPHIDEKQVCYLGAVNDDQKNELLGGAAALLMPILWEEPFGIVMAEALACGTPVLGFRRGAVPEVVADGHTGFVRDSIEELVEATFRLDTIDRYHCRQRAEALFGDTVVVDRYLSIYQEMTDAHHRR